MKIKTVYQTLEDRGGDLDKLEEEGPYPCDWRNSWLGDGYYFWDSFVENAHWWGKEVRQYPDGYIICKAICDYDSEKCFDLVGNTDHLTKIWQVFQYMKSQNLANKTTTVSKILNFMMKKSGFHYEASRVCGMLVRKPNSEFTFKQNFEYNPKKPKFQYMEYKPPIQICFYQKKNFNLRDFRVIYPDEYVVNYV